MGKQQFIIPAENELDSISKPKFVIPKEDEISSILSQKKNLNQSGTELSGVKPLSDTNEEEGMFSKVLMALPRAFKGFGEGAWNKIIDEGIGAARELTVNLMPDKFFAPKKMSFEEKLKAYESTFAPMIESQKAGIKGTANIVDEGGLRLPDPEAFGAAVGEQLMQLQRNTNVGGMILNHLSFAESNYQEARQRGIDPTKSYFAGHALALTETLIDKYSGIDKRVDKFVSGKLGKIASDEAIDQIIKLGIKSDVFDEAVKTSGGLIKNLFTKGIAPESISEGIQQVVTTGEKQLFDIYQKATNQVNEGDIDKKGQYGADVFSMNTVRDVANSSFMGGLIGGLGYTFTSSGDFNPTIYATLQREYNEKGKDGLNTSIENVKTGITKASEAGKLTPEQYNAALQNVDKIAKNVSSFEQNSKIDPYSRYSLFNVEENLIPMVSNGLAKDLAQMATPLELPTTQQIDDDIAQGNVTPVSFDHVSDIPDSYRNFAAVADDQNGNKVIQFQVPNSIVKAHTDNQMAVQTLMNNPLFAIKSLSENNKLITIEDLDKVGLGGGEVFPSSASQLQFKVKFEQNRPQLINGLKTINYLKSVSNQVKETGKAADPVTFSKAINNITNFNTGDTVFYNNKAHKIAGTSPDGQMLNLSGVKEQVSASDENIKTQREAEEVNVEQPTVTDEIQQPKAKKENRFPTTLWLKKFVLDGNNEPLTERQIGSVEKAILMSIAQGKTAGETVGILNGLGFVADMNESITLTNYIQDRIDGKQTKPYNEIHGTKPETLSPTVEDDTVDFPSKTIGDAVYELTPFVYQGKTGRLRQQSNGVVMFETKDRDYELGNISDIGDMALAEWDIVQQEMSTDKGFNVTIDGKTFTNKNQNPFAAITYDENGNPISVKLQDGKGKTKVIKGTRALLIDAQYKERKILNESTDEQLNEVEQQVTAGTENIGNAEPTTVGGQVKPVETAFTEKQRERQRTINDVAKRLAQETENTKNTKEAIANVTSSLFKAGIKVQVLTSAQIKEKYNDGDTSQGFFIAKDGTIIINQNVIDSEWGKTIVFHEGTHPIINVIRNTDPKTFKQLIDAIRDMRSTNTTIDSIIKSIETNPTYKGKFTQNDEIVVETIARIASGKLKLNELPITLSQKIKDLINKIGRALGFKQVIRDNNDVAFVRLANQIAEVLNTGRDISEIVGAENVSKFAVASDIQSQSENSAIYGGGIQQSEIERSKVSNKPLIDVYQKEEVVSLPVRSMQDIYNSYGGKVVMINSDATRVGNLTLPSGKEIFLYGGTEYIALEKNVKGNVGFATTLEGKLKTHEKLRNKVFGNQDGVTVVVSQAPPAILSNSYTLRYLMDAISQLPKAVLSNPKFKSEFFGSDIVAVQKAFGQEGYQAFIDKYGDTDFTSKEAVELMIEELGYKLSADSSPASFEGRGTLASNLTAGLVTKASRAATRGELGYTSIEPKKFIAKSLLDQFGINTEKIIRDLGSKGIVDEYFNNGVWGLAVGGFENSADIGYESVQDKGVNHPLFNAKFYGKNPFVLDSGYKVDDLILPVETFEDAKGKPYKNWRTGENEPYIKKTSLMLSKSIYVGGDIEAQLSDIDRTYTPESTVADAGMTIAERETWREKNKVSQKQKRVPVVMQASRDLYNGNITFDNYVNTVRDNMPIMPFTNVPKLPTLKEIISALNEDKLTSGGIVGVNKTFADGERVASRLDIPAYENYDTWVVSIHDSAKERILGYGQTAVLKNVQFKTSPKIGLSIAANATFLNDMDKESKGKATIARIHGDWVNESPEAVHKRATELMNDPAWTQVGMNPFRHSFFYDKTTGEAVTSAEEVIQVGALVLAKNVERAPFGSQAFNDNFTFKNKLGEQIQFSEISRDDARINALRNEYYNNDVTSDVLIEAAKKEYGLDQAAAEMLVSKAIGSVLDLKPYESNNKAELSDEQMPTEVESILAKYSEGYEKDKANKLKEESKKKTFADYAVQLYDSKFKIRRILQSLSDVQTLSSARLRNIMGKAKASSMEAQQAIAEIYGGLGEKQIKALDELIFALRVIQLDKNNSEKVYIEYDRLRKQFIRENNGKLPNEKDLERLMDDARKSVPEINHGLLDSRLLYTAKTAQNLIDALRGAYSTEDFDNLMSRAAAYKRVGNESINKMQEAGMLSKEIADKYKDDFYTFRKTLERYYDDYSSNVPIYYKDGVAYYSAFKSLGEGSKDSYFQRDSRVLLAENILIVNKAIAKNNLRKSIFDDIMSNPKDFFTNANSKQSVILDKNGADLSFAFKPAVYERTKDGNVKQEASGYVAKPASEGFVNVPFRVDGKLQYFQMQKDLYDEVEGLNSVFNPQDSGGIVMKYYDVSNAANTILTATQTRYSPFFFWRNMSMDIRHQVHFTDYWTSDKNFLKSNVFSAYGRLLFQSIKNSKKIFANDEDMLNLLDEATKVGLFMDTYSEAKEQVKRSSEIDVKSLLINKQSKWESLKKGVSSLNVKTEIAMRISAYEQAKKHLTEQYKKLNNITELNDAQSDEINEIASAQARGYTDFAQKGTFTPHLNYAYLNASIQGLGSALEYSYDNPAKTLRKSSELFIGHMLWTTMLMMAIPDLYDELDEYTKDIHMLSPIGFMKDKLLDSLGLPSFFIPTSKIDPTLVPLMGIARRTAEHFVKNMRGEKTEPLTYEEVTKLINIALPSIFSIPEKTAPVDAAADWGSKILSGSALLSSGTKLFSGYDAFRGQSVDAKGYQANSNLLDGMTNPDIPYIYKIFAKAAALATEDPSKIMSPARINAAAESIVGSPKSSFLTGILTAVASDIANLIIPASEIEKSDITLFNPKNILKSFGVLTDSGLKERLQNKKFLEESNNLNLKAADIETIADKNIDLFYKQNPTTFMSRVEKYSQEWDYAGDEDATDRLIKKAELKFDKLEKKSGIPKDISNEVKIIYYTKGTDNQAKMLKSMAGEDRKMATKILESLSGFGMDEGKIIEIEEKYYKK